MHSEQSGEDAETGPGQRSARLKAVIEMMHMRLQLLLKLFFVGVFYLDFFFNETDSATSLFLPAVVPCFAPILQMKSLKC